MDNHIELKDLYEKIKENKISKYVYNTENNIGNGNRFIITSFNSIYISEKAKSIIFTDSNTNNIMRFLNVDHCELNKDDCLSWKILTLFCKNLDKSYEKYIIVCS